MWGGFGGLVFKCLASIAGYFAIFRAGGRKQELKSVQKSLEQGRVAHEIDEDVNAMSDSDIDDELYRNQRH